jgi:hypothetical protein
MTDAALLALGHTIPPMTEAERKQREDWKNAGNKERRK